MLISVIIPVWNDEKRISFCLDALSEQTIGLDNFEVFVVNNASTDGTAKVLEAYPWITVLYESKEGSYVARNRAIGLAKGEYLAFTDSDCIPSKSWLQACVNCASQHSDFGVIAGKVAFFEALDSHVEQSALDFETLFSMDQKINSQSGVSITANFFVKREVVLSLGGFNASLKSGGDHALSKRIFALGKPVIYCADGVVSHPARNIKELLNKRRRVIGGSWDDSQSKNKVFTFTWRATKLLLKRQFKVILTGKVTFKSKPSISWLLIRIYFVSLSEIFRLSNGGISSRS
ncbi:glycosyltransferase family A protein [Paraglaciecola agarilytica]|uniref:glycosyltransferase n=1 Tax=Paraglaciecola chathamensis TaxID=368405 RepID=UPI00235675D7|nr:glycosyltransferase family A protein [Paraglaciecola agarilytica]